MSAADIRWPFISFLREAPRDYLVGISLLLVVTFLWTSSSFVTQNIFEGGYAKPFLITYLNTSAFALYLLPSLAKPVGTTQYQGLVQHEPTLQLEEPEENTHQPTQQPLSTGETAKLASIFCIIWFAANWTVNAALGYTSVASTTVLSSTSGFFTVVIGGLFRVEALNKYKIGAVVLSFIGVVLVANSDARESGSPLDDSPRPSWSNALLGDALALSSAVCYAIYVILLKVNIVSESRINMKLFFGFVGVFNIVFCWPLGVVFHFTGVERFELPAGWQTIGPILINMFITVSSDYLYVLAMLKTTPLVVTIGLSLTIPMATFGDFLVGRLPSAQALLGACLVLVSFTAVNLDTTASKPVIELSHPE